MKAMTPPLETKAASSLSSSVSTAANITEVIGAGIIGNCARLRPISISKSSVQVPAAVREDGDNAAVARNAYA